MAAQMTAKLPASAYPTRAAIERALKAAKAVGIKPAGFRVEPGGAIVIFDAATAPKDEFEQWQASRPA